MPVAPHADPAHNYPMLPGFKRRRLMRHRTLLREHSLKGELLSMGGLLCGLLVLHIFAMIHLEGLSPSDAIWLTLTSATTVGYGDLSAQTTWGRVATILLIYLGGVAILAQVAAMYFEYRQTRRQRMLSGDWSWTMKDHIVFLNCPPDGGEDYYYQAISALRASRAPEATLPIIIVSERFPHGLPQRLRELDVVHVNKPLGNQETLESANVTEAKVVVVLCTAQPDTMSDSISFDLVDRLRGMGVKGRIIAETVKDLNRERLKRAGADNVLRPIRAYPELLIRSIIAPGSEQIIETLFDSHGEECVRCEVPFDAVWADIVTALTQEDLGLPIAYEASEGAIIKNPSAKSAVSGRALFVIVRAELIGAHSAIQNALQRLSQRAA